MKREKKTAYDFFEKHTQKRKKKFYNIIILFIFLIIPWKLETPRKKWVVAQVINILTKISIYANENKHV